VIKNIIKKLESLNKKLKSWQSNPEPLEHNEMASIKFNILENGEIKIFLHWDEDIKGLSSIFSKLLFHINEGDYQKSIIDIMSQIGDDSDVIEQQTFITKVFDKWAALSVERQVEYLRAEKEFKSSLQNNNANFENKPIITPSKVFGEFHKEEPQ